ncbi:MAG TPA: hypothetical protein VGR52_01140 [Stellaceae bacterium]|nr:hypothetical protein [Stellaceae bacterium]
MLDMNRLARNAGRLRRIGKLGQNRLRLPLRGLHVIRLLIGRNVGILPVERLGDRDHGNLAAEALGERDAVPCRIGREF